MLWLLNNPRLADRIGLTDEQRVAIQADVKELDEELDVLRPHLQEAAQAQAELLRGEDPDEDRIMTAVEETWRLRTEMAKIQTRKILAVRAHLTEEQRAGIQEMTETVRARMGRDRAAPAPGQRPGAAPARPVRPTRPEGEAPAVRPEGRRPAGEGARPARPAAGRRVRRGDRADPPEAGTPAP